MKKITFLFAALASTMAFTSCDESKDDHPVLEPNEGVIVENFLNTPEMSNMSVEFAADNQANTIHMTCSQPSYGYAATVRYNVEVSFDKDFATPIVPDAPVSATLNTAFYDCSEINPTYGELATAMCGLLGIKNDKEIPTGYHDLYARLVANIEVAGGANFYPNTTYQSNVVKLTRANCTYLAIIVPGQPTGIYLRGGMNNWGNDGWLESHPEWQFLTTDAAGVYYIADVTIPADTEFKVADANWTTINFGGTCGEVTTLEAGKPFELNTDPANGGPGNLKFDKNFTGSVTLTFKAGKYTILFECDEPDTPDQPSGIFIRGDMNGWDTSNEFLTTDFKNNWIVKGITINAGETFKIGDAGWSSVNLGSNGEALEIGVPYELVKDGGNIECPASFSGDIKLQLKGGSYKITLVAL